MNEDQIAKGQEQLRLMAGSFGQAMVDKVKRESPELAQFVLGFGFGEIYAREGLSYRDKEMLSIASLVSQGDTANQLRFHFSAALTCGLTEREVTEILIHCIPHVGIPKVMNAFNVFGALLKERQTSEEPGD
ncbi:carboxymuconolactone decarboxylase family protein [Paenibacillus filicis]|uniref:Carboxymuconolactone decarboxylase family protein n=1 Tax=Paenibacillus filicis TaxID=669464 RepID=A0ABU9DGN3_9BACL